MKIIIELHNVYSEICSELPSEALEEISNSCSYLQKTFNSNFGTESFSQISIFNLNSKTFPTGLHARVIKKLKQLGYGIAIKDLRDKPKTDLDRLLNRASEFGLALRDYQIEGIIAGLETNCGLFNWCTGSGKTVIFSFLLMAYDKPSLILVNRKELMEQISKELSYMTGNSVGQIGDGIWQPSKWTVGIVNTLNRGLNSDSESVKIKTRRFLEGIDVFIGDEIHHLGARTWKEIAKTTKNASVRF